MSYSFDNRHATVGIIAEYNPFHNGHLYQLTKAKELSKSRYVIVIMSGSFVQRGTPAFIHKVKRTQMALENGADLVIELPVRYATGSAEFFSLGAVSLLHNLQVVDFLCFGSESGNTAEMKRIADFILKDCDAFNNSIAKHVKNGYSYPAAREQSLIANCKELSENKVKEIMSSPNNILGIEYLKSLGYLNSSMTPLTVMRKQAGYHDPFLISQSEQEASIHSATAIRAEIEQTSSLDKIRHSVPSTVYHLLAKDSAYPVTSSMLSDMLYFAIASKSAEELSLIQDVTPDLARSIKKNLHQYEDFEQFISVLKSKQFTYTRINRCLLHIVLGMKQYSLKGLSSNAIAPYARVLGFRKDASDLLKKIKQNSQIPMITKIADAKNILDSSAYKILSEDVFATSLYNRLVYKSFRIKNKLDIQTSPVIL